MSRIYLGPYFRAEGGKKDREIPRLPIGHGTKDKRFPQRLLDDDWSGTGREKEKAVPSSRKFAIEGRRIRK